MEIIQNKYNNFSKVYRALQNGNDLLKNLPSDTPDDLRNIIIAGVIKHFELAYEMCWKYLKAYLKIKLDIDCIGSKDIFRSCYKYKILPLEVTDALLLLIDDRNLTVHIYDQITALEICKQIEKHCVALDKVLGLMPSKDNHI